MISLLTVILATAACFQNAQVYAIMGGTAAKDGEFPFMVSIRTSGSANCHFCAGTIISNRWILTSNACYSQSWWASISFGTINNPVPVNYACEPYNHSLQRSIDDVLYNPKAYDRPPWTHDLVLVHLNESIPFSENVQPVKLADENDEWPAGKNGIIIGWGYGNCLSNVSSTQVNLQKAEVPLYSEEYCSNSSVWGGWILTDPSVMLCGGGNGEPYYSNLDLGGPLLVDGKQYGIISYIHTDLSPREEPCGKYPGIFSPISYFRQWIRDTTGV